jgi:L-lactate dehydrogenase complex protein LldG
MKYDEPTSTSARDTILRTIRDATGEPANANFAQAATGWTALPRLYRRSYENNSQALVKLMMERLTDYDAHVERVPDSNVSEVVQGLLLSWGLTKVLIPAGFPEQWRPHGIETTEGDRFGATIVESFDGVLTTATLGIAETGTLVLTHGPGQGKRALSLLPDNHLCVLRAADVVPSVPHAFTRLASASRQQITFISGPSATADIEMTRIKGVHGPRFLSVLLVDEDA